MSCKELEALRQLITSTAVIVLPADKCNATVIMISKDYDKLKIH